MMSGNHVIRIQMTVNLSLSPTRGSRIIDLEVKGLFKSLYILLNLTPQKSTFLYGEAIYFSPNRFDLGKVKTVRQMILHKIRTVTLQEHIQELFAKEGVTLSFWVLTNPPQKKKKKKKKKRPSLFFLLWGGGNQPFKNTYNRVNTHFRGGGGVSSASLPMPCSSECIERHGKRERNINQCRVF